MITLMFIELILRKREKLMNKWVKNGLILTATLGLLVVFAPKDGPPHQINPVIEKRTKATADEKKYNKEIAKGYAYAAQGWRGSEWECLLALWTHESRFDNFAENQSGSTAFGIAQLLGEKDVRAEYQILKGLKYIKHRYNTPCRAYDFWKSSEPRHY